MIAIVFGGTPTFTALQAVKHYIMEHLKCWQHLAHDSQLEGMHLFRLRPKAHYLQHIARDCARNLINPRLVTACFYDESFLGYIKKVAVGCHSTTMIRQRFWQRYMLFLSIRFEKNRSHSRD